MLNKYNLIFLSLLTSTLGKSYLGCSRNLTSGKWRLPHSCPLVASRFWALVCLHGAVFPSPQVSSQGPVWATISLGSQQIFQGSFPTIWGSDEGPGYRHPCREHGLLCLPPFTPAGNPFLDLGRDFQSWCFLLPWCPHPESCRSSKGHWNSFKTIEILKKKIDDFPLSLSFFFF